jgi:hypothetical protein
MYDVVQASTIVLWLVFTARIIVFYLASRFHQLLTNGRTYKSSKGAGGDGVK